MKIKIWGTRGSIPVPGKGTIKYGGNTPCVQIVADNGNHLVLDAGSGIREYGDCLLEHSKQKEVNIFITHSHWDHIQGLLFFKPMYLQNYTINLYAPAVNIETVKNIIDIQMQSEYFPVKSDILKAKINYFPVSAEENLKLYDIDIYTIRNHHSGLTLSYKLIDQHTRFVYMTDNEIYQNDCAKKISDECILDKNGDLIEFAKNADYLLHDCMYDPTDYESKVGWGHSNNLAVSHFANLARVKNLFLFHYDPNYNDAKLEEILRNTQSYLADMKSSTNCFLSEEKLEINFK
ncbi:MAG: MBL fold metallo-hydrolase [Melioribacteraceae bacterium]|nr:MBL fold metallo-hydrolase [Melioribacteraceae bacterium]MCO6473629.1 MBL fold metallo-hydrolase [Melioribacteraceae bacterium]MDD3557734.1 MBL fold metallo-hydrolase [Melioribacteraceae bacterium]